MAAKTTLNAKNLEALGAQRLAELLIEISTGSAAHKRRLRMELAGNHSTDEAAREIRKRLSSIARAKISTGARSRPRRRTSRRSGRSSSKPSPLTIRRKLSS